LDRTKSRSQNDGIELERARIGSTVFSTHRIQLWL